MRTVELINPVTGLWDEALIRENFLQVDAENILTIPISEHMTEDFVAWHKTKTYTFSVRSAYYTEWEHQFSNRIQRRDRQGSVGNNPAWDKLWKLQVPGKVKTFRWRALHGVVPGRSILASRHIRVR